MDAHMKAALEGALNSRQRRRWASSLRGGIESQYRTTGESGGNSRRVFHRSARTHK
ncbi:hypothetical protein KCP73_14410 [Salmonella enterica subsp. enterica]|nr:hypothetical protein KCP73_14410 [Salmonella enterica subsp. enterica]